VDVFTSQAVNRVMDPVLGKLEMDVRGSNVGWNAGLTYALPWNLCLGVTYRSRIDVHHEGDVEVAGLGISGSADTELVFPEVWAAGLQWAATPDLRIEFVAERSGWSAAEWQVVQTNTILGTIPYYQNWSDTWVLMIGAEYDINDTWTVRTGYGYNETPAPAETTDPSLPAGDTHAGAVGASCRLRENLVLDLALLVAYSEENDLRSPAAPPGSTYDSLGYFVSAGVRYRF
jgi:long-chain fatty acid transport protein